jgi:DnaA family protein
MKATNEPPRQIAFDFAAPPARFENFIAGNNAECLARLRALDFPAVLYLWGETGSGKSHLLAAAAAHAEQAQTPVVVADDAQNLDAAAQEALFDAFNATLTGGPKLIVAGDRAPLQLTLREDLRTRLGAGLVYALQPLSDAEKRLAILAAGRARGMPLSDEFVDHLLNHFQRDLRSLMGLIDALDRYSLAAKRAVTLPLLREVLQHHRPPR